ncbi:replication initiator protein A [Janthinobacterium sp. CAN_S7]|uniref:replication initiator protein A n=1 Tax=Janthinobacterium sp. CAN_S7 TaxID=3071704 RepID=UPI00319DE78C
MKKEVIPSAQFPVFDEEQTSQLSPLAKRVHLLGQRPRKEVTLAVGSDVSQLDLFVADLLDYNLKDDKITMEAPLFSLSTKPDHETWRWVSTDGKKWIEVTPSSIGRATMHDKDLLIYITSQLVAAMNEATRNNTKMPGRRVRFTLHDYLSATGKATSGRAYKLFEETLDRLSGTRLKTNIEMGDQDHRSSFGLIEQSDYILETDGGGRKRMTAIEITVSRWLYRAMEEKNVLTISKSYFGLRKPLEKKLYELARKHVGTQAEWFIKEDNLYNKVGSRSSMPEFRRMLKAIILDDNIPEYRIIYTESINHLPMLRFYQKDVQKYAAAYAKGKR